MVKLGFFLRRLNGKNLGSFLGCSPEFPWNSSIEMVFSILEPHKHKWGLCNHNPDGTKSKNWCLQGQNTPYLFRGAPVLCSGVSSPGGCLSQPLTLGVPFWWHFSDTAMTPIVNALPHYTHSRYKNCAALKTPARTWQSGGGNSAAVTGWGWDR